MRFWAIILTLVLIFTLSGVTAQDLSSDVLVIKKAVVEGESVIEPINLANLGANRNFVVDHFSKEKFLQIGEDDLDFILDEEGEKILEVVLDSQDLSPGVYTGRMILEGEGFFREIIVILEVESKLILFDVAEKEPVFQVISPGEEIRSDVIVYNLGALNGRVILNYSITGLGGNVVISEQEIENVLDQAEINKSFLIPEDTPIGDYVFSVTSRQGGSVGTHSSVFSLAQEESASSFIVIIIVILILFFFYCGKKRKKVKSKSRKRVK